MQQINAQSHFSSLVEQAKTSPRQRSHLCLHKNGDDRVQRIVIAMTNQSLVIPHRHNLPHQNETIVMMDGACTALIFNEQQQLVSKTLLSADNSDILVVEPGTWHSLICETEECIFFEIKGGPYDPNNAAEIQQDAPIEGTTEASEYLRQLKHLDIGSALA